MIFKKMYSVALDILNAPMKSIFKSCKSNYIPFQILKIEKVSQLKKALEQFDFLNRQKSPGPRISKYPDACLEIIGCN